MKRFRRHVALAAACGSAIAGFGLTARGADQTAFWVNPVWGDWEEASFWSTDPVIPNNLPGQTFDVVLDAQGAHHTISIRSDVTVDNLSIESPFARLDLQGRTLEVFDTLRVDAGVFSIIGGTLEGTRLETAPTGQSRVAQNTTGVLDAVSLRGGFLIDRGTTLTVRNGLMLDEGELFVGDNNGAGSTARFTGDQSIGGTGFITLRGVGGPTVRVGSGTLTLGPMVTMRNTLSAYGHVTIGGEGTSAHLINDGTIRSPVNSLWITVLEGGSFTNNNLVWAQSGGDVTMRAQDGPMVNQGTLRASAGGILRLEGDWTNHGQIIINGGLLDLRGVVDLTRLQGVSRINDGQIRISGTLDNTGKVLELDEVLGNLEISGKLIGGTVASASGRHLRLFQGQLQGTVLETDMEVIGAVRFLDGLELRGTTVQMTLSPGYSDRRMLFEGVQEFKGAGTVLMEGTALYQIWSNPSDGALTIGPGIAIEVGSANLVIGRDLTPTSTINLGGTINVGPGGTLTLRGNWTNAGQITLSDSTLNLEGEFSFEQFSGITAAGGQTNFRGVLNNTGFAFNLNTQGTNWNLDGGTIKGGRLRSGDGQPVVIGQGERVTLEGIQLDTDLDLLSGGDLTIKGDLNMVGGSVLRSVSQATLLKFAGVQKIFGTGEIVASGNSSFDLRPEGAVNRLTISQNIVIRNSDQANIRLGTSVSQKITNYGTISSEAPSREVLLAGDWENYGTLRVIDGRLILGGWFRTEALGTIDRQGGILEFRGKLDNTGHVLNLDPQWGSIPLTGSIVGGTVVAPNADSIVPANGGFDGVFFDGDMVIPAGKNLNIWNALTIADGRTWEVNANSDLRLIRVADLEGNAEILLLGDRASVDVSLDSNLTIGPGIAIRKVSAGSSNLGDSANKRIWTNRGLIEVDHPEGILVFRSGWANEGTVRLAQGRLLLEGVFTIDDLGTIERTGGTLEIGGSLDNQGRDTTLNPAMGEVRFNRGKLLGGRLATTDGLGVVFDRAELHGATLALDGDGLVLPNIQVFGGLTLEDTTLRLGQAQAGGVPSGGVFLSDGGMLGGTGLILFDGTDQSNNRVHGPGMVIGPDITIRTYVNGGRVGGPTHTWTNQGLIHLQTPGTVMSIEGNWTNQGTLRVEDGELQLHGTFTTPGIGHLERTGGQVAVLGTLNNAGHTLALNEQTGSWLFLVNSRINGGTVTTADGVSLITYGTTTNQRVTLDHVALDADVILTQASRLESLGGLNLPAGRSISLESSQSWSPELIVTGGQGITGGGEIVFSGTRSDQSVLTRTDPTLTIGPDITIRTGESGGVVGIFTSTIRPNIVNHGLISARTADKTITIRGLSLTNHGTLEATNGGTLRIEPPLDNQGTVRVQEGIIELAAPITTAQLPVIERLGGIIRLHAQLNNTDDTLALDDLTTSYALGSGGSVLGGRIEAAGGGPLLVQSSSGPNLIGVELAAEVHIQSSAALRLSNLTQLTPDGSIHLLPQLETSTATLNVDAALLLEAQGEVVFGGLGTGTLAQVSGILEIGPELLIRTSTGRGVVGGGVNSATLTAAHVMAEGVGRSITLTGSSQNINTGLIEALDGATVVTRGRWRNEGVITLNNGLLSIEQITGGGRGGPGSQPALFDIAAAGILQGTGAMTADITGGLTNAGLIAPGLPIGDLSFAGLFTQTAGGVLEIDLAGHEPGQSFDRFLVDGTINLGGTLALRLADGFIPATGDRFDVLPFTGMRNGQFAAVTGEVFAPGGYWRAVYEEQVVAVQYVVMGDLDGNGVFNAFDVGAFEMALADPEAYAAAYPALDPALIGDFNGDGVLDAFDVAAFEAGLANGGGGSIPEPASGVLMLLACSAARRGRR